ncbi:hypothetical protein H3Z85_12320 [Chryseobacterium indologenes]|uniref:hypothetical protein n=1 Tax=Chryseobacterium indologenes TaxID=253 RepID=UPI0003E074D4|nr:hypothetical protein [Chryseobacterium indologenes]QPQ50305.1 hypothetical protein H3Z85_12320 [Chryseobacterium indologenes]GAE66970.1 hypothetical protein CIN01S_29_00010 [Chryseobacterium indologenes NBRC 14944]VFA43733.1 Uncharacterised protein [Chryseobacterium indologenes]
MRKIGIICLILFLSCNEKVKTIKILGPENKLKYVYKTKGDITTIYDYARDGKLMMKLNFKQDQFIDTIYFYDFDNHYTVIDSSKGKYFYGTQILTYDNGKYAYKGPYRYTKNTDPKEVSKSLLKFGHHSTYNVDGSLREELNFKIIGDSSFVVSTKN